MSDLHPIWYVASRDTPEKSVMIHETVLIYLIKELDDEQAKMDLLLYLQQTFVYHHETWYMSSRSGPNETNTVSTWLIRDMKNCFFCL